MKINKYLYNGKEMQDDLNLGMYDYGARFYDPVIGRWNGMDPLAEKFSSWTPYHFVHNNPIKLIDPDERASMPPSDYYDEQGNWIYNDGKYDDKVYDIIRLVAVSSDIKGNDQTNIKYVGQIRNVKMSFNGEANSGNSNQADGQVNVIQEVSNGRDYIRAVFDAVGGPWGNGSPEKGNYLANTLLDRSSTGWYNEAMTKDGIGFSLNIDPQFKTGRTLLRIHPDGGKYFATQGCIGLTNGKSALSTFQSLMKSVLSKQDNILLNISIKNNPNNNGYGKRAQSFRE